MRFFEEKRNILSELSSNHCRKRRLRRALQESTELAKVQSSNFTSEEEPTSELAPCRYPVNMKFPSQKRRQSLHAISEMAKSLEFFRFTFFLLLSATLPLCREGFSTGFAVFFRMALIFQRALIAICFVERYCELFRFLIKRTALCITSCRASQNSVSFIIQFKSSKKLVWFFTCKIGVYERNIVFCGGFFKSFT